MTKHLFIFILSVVSFTAKSQYENHYLGVKTGYLSLQDYEPRVYSGLELDIAVNNKVNIQYSLLFSKNYFHMPLAPPIGFLVGLIASNSKPPSDSTDTKYGMGIIAGIIVAIIPESIGFNIPISRNATFTPYISPLQLEFIKNTNEAEGNWYAGGGVGLKYHLITDNQRYRISPYFEYKIHYTSNIHNGFSTGVSISTRIGKIDPKS